MSLAVVENISTEMAARIEALPLDRRRPLLVCDADEVLVAFMDGLEAFLADRGLYFNWTSYRLLGNIHRRTDDASIDEPHLRRVLDEFHDGPADRLDAVPGAADALSALAPRTQVVILTNIPPHRRRRRERMMSAHGMPYPVIANDGLKGAAIEVLATRIDAPVCFVDDHPGHHSDVARRAAQVLRLHFIAHPRLLTLIGRAADSDHHVSSWPDARGVIDRHLAAHGF